MSKAKGNKINIRPFFYLRADDVIMGGRWISAKRELTYGGDIFPDNAIQLKCKR
jgi:hypothetical protein